MTRFYFDLYNDDETADEEGVEFESLEAARQYAVGEVRSLAAHSVRDYSHLVLSHRLVIRDATGEVDTVTFGEVIDVRP